MAPAPKAKTYEELLEQAQGFLKRDLETRFKIANLLKQMNAYKSMSKIAADLGWNLTDVSQSIHVIEIWGDRRIPSKWGMRPAAWRDYTIVTSQSMNPYTRERYINTVLEHGTEGEAEVQRVAMRKAMAERAREREEERRREEEARKERRANMTERERQAESKRYSIIYASSFDSQIRNVLKHTAPQIEALDNRSREILEKLYDDLITEFARFGIVELPDYMKQAS